MPPEHRETLRNGKVFTAKHLLGKTIDDLTDLGIPARDADYYLRIAQFVQLPRCGPTYAQILISIGYKTPSALVGEPSKKVAAKVAAWIRVNNMDTAPPTTATTFKWVEAAAELG